MELVCIHGPLLWDTSYLIIAVPPLLEGAAQFRVTLFIPMVVLRLIGAPGSIKGVVKINSSLIPEP